MYNKIIFRRAPKLFVPFWAGLALLGFIVAARAQSVPFNDNLTNAQPVAGVSGSVTGSNLGATAEKSEPPSEILTGNQAGATIWYNWTCPVTGVYDFNTRGSTDQNGPLDTVMSIYTLASSSKLAFSNLTLAAINDDDDNTNSWPAVSRAYFYGAAGTTYYIQVDGKKNLTTGTNAEGTIVLNWGPNPFGGVFTFTSSYYAFGQNDDELVPVSESTLQYNSYYPSLSNPDTTNSFFTTTNVLGLDTLVPQGRVTITREIGYAGRCSVDISLAPNYYNNLYMTNMWASNVTTALFDPSGILLGYTNVIITNINRTFQIQYDSFGAFTTYLITNYTQISVTNVNGNNVSVYVTNICDGYVKPDDGNGPTGPIMTVTNFDTTGSNIVSYLESQTNLTSSITSQSVTTPAAIDGIDFFSSDAQTVTFDDFQMSKDVFLTVSPGNSPGNSTETAATPDWPDINGYRIVQGINRSVTLTLSNPRLDPLESLDVIPPEIGGNTTADMNILDFYTEPSHDPCATNNRVFNFMRPHFRCLKNVVGTNLTIWVFRSGPVNNSDSVQYYIDSEDPLIYSLEYHTFPTDAGSDYAIGVIQGDPGVPTNNYDFVLPYVGLTGSLSFPANNSNPQAISIPINNSGAVEFNEDFYIELYEPGTPPPPTLPLGSISAANVTVLFDDSVGGQQPGGANDRTWDMDNAPPAYNLAPGANYQVDAIAVQPDGMSVIGGHFTAFNGSPANYLVRTDTNGLPDPAFNLGEGPDQFVDAIAIDSAGNILIAGAFSSVKGPPSREHIARLNRDGSLDGSFNTGAGAQGGSGDYPGIIRAIALDANGDILIGGNFTTFNNTPRNHIARLLPNGTLDTNFNPGSGPNQDVDAIALDSLGNVIIGGAFTSYNGTNSAGLARLLPSGALDPTFHIGSGVNGTVYSVAVAANNQIVIGGGFSQVNLAARTGIARLNFNGSVDTNFNANPGPNDTVYAVAIQPDGEILVGGQFTSIGLVRRVGYARLLTNGWVDPSFLDTSYNQFAGLINHYYNPDAYNENDAPAQFNTPNDVFAIAFDTTTSNVMIGGSFARIGGGFTRDDVRVRLNVARVIGAPTPGPMVDGGGIGNNPGTITFTQPAYSFGNLSGRSFINVIRTNGSLGQVSFVMGTNTLPTGPGAATSADFALFNNGTAQYGLTPDKWGPENYGWRGPTTSGLWGPNSYPLPPSLPTNSQSAFLDVVIFNDKAATQNLSAGLSLLSVSGHDLLFLGGEDIPTEPTVGLSSALLNIIYPPPASASGLLGFTATNYPVVESAGFITITVARTNGSTGKITVHYATQDGFTNGGFAQVAHSGTDYIATNNTLTMLDGVASATFNVQIIDHSTLQSNKFFNVILSSPNGAGFDTNNPPILATNSVVTIVDDHFSPGHLSFTSSAFTGVKGGVSTITVQRSGGGLGTVSVQVFTADGTGSNGVNYVGVTNTLTWGNSNIAPQTVLITNLQDYIVEGNKTVNLFLTNAVVAGNGLSPTNVYVLIPPTNATLTINESDFYGTLVFSPPNVNVLQNAGQVLVTVARTNGTSGTVQINYATSNGTNADPRLNALAGTNYGATNGTLVFASGVTSQTFTVPIYYTPAETNQANRLFNLTLSNPSPTNINAGFPKTGTVTILDNQLVTGAPGSVDTTLQIGTGFNDVVQSICLQPDGKVLAGGNFTFVNQYPLNQLARLNADGSVDTGFLYNQAGADGIVWMVLSQTPAAGQTNGSIIAVGDFTNMDAVPRSGIARLNLDGSLDSTFNPGAGADSTIYTVVQMPTNQFPSPTYVIGGNFATFNGVPRSGLARITSSGQVDLNFNPGAGVTSINGAVHALAVDDNFKVIVGGNFTLFNNLPYHHLVRLNLDGSIDSTFNPDTGATVSGSVQAIAIQPDGKILIGGVFTNVNGSNFHHIARLNLDGTLDANFNPGVGANNTVLALAVDSQWRILVAGQFTTASGVTRNGLTRLNPDGTVDPTINFGAGATGANAYVDTIAIQPNDEINIGGSFTNFGGVAQNNFTRLYAGAVSGAGTLNFSQAVFGVLQSQSNAVISIQRSGGTGSISIPLVSAVFSTSNGTAIAGVDYLAVTNTVSFPVGETFTNVSVPILNSGAVASDKTVNLGLSNPFKASLGSQLNATLVITNVNSAVAFSAANYRQPENIPGGNAVIPIVRTGSPLNTVTVTVYTGATGTARPNIDYTPQTSTLVFPPGLMTNLFLVPLLNSPTMFSDATVDLELTGAAGGFLVSPSQATLTIATVNAGPGIVAFDQTNYVVSEGATNAPITLIRTNGVTGPVSVTLSTSNGTAIAGVNYQAVHQVVNFSDSQSSQTVNIPVIQQSNATPDTTVYLVLSNPTNTTIGGTNVEVLTIQNNIENFTFSSPDYFVGEGGGAVTLVIYRNGPTNGTVTVGYATSSPTNASPTNGYAVPGVNYTPASGTLSFAPGQTIQTVPVAIHQGITVDGPLTFQVNLTNASAGTQIGAPGTAEVTIIGNVTGFNFSTNAYSVGENGTNLVVTVNRLNVNTGNVQVNFATSDGTASAGTDYVATNGVLSFLDGQASTTFTVSILNPNIIEADKTFNLTLSNPISTTSTNCYLVSPSNSVVTITNVLTGIGFSSPVYSVGERGVQAQITVVRSGVTSSNSTVSFATANGSGAAGTNYLATNGLLTFAPGVTAMTFSVVVIDDHVITADHTVILNLSSPQGAILASPNTAVLTIQEGDGSYILAAGTWLSSESLKPTNGIIDPGETVTVWFGLRCVSGGNTANLMATLQTNSGVTPSLTNNNPTNYGVLVQGGHSVSRPFTFTANGTNSQVVNATFQLTDGTNNLTTVVFPFTLGISSTVFSNNALIIITNFVSDGLNPSKAIPYPSTINVSGVPGAIGKATVSFNNLTHSLPSDIEAVLVSPSQNVLLMNCVGGGNGKGVTNTTITFDDNAANYLSTAQLVNNISTTNKPTPYVNNNGAIQFLGNQWGFLSAMPSPAPAAPYPTNLSALAGTVANGIWSLYVADTMQQDFGMITSGWSLNLGAGNPVPSDADLEISVVPVPSTATVSNVLTYAIGLTNYGPATATGVVVTNPLPSGLTYQSNTFSGAFTNNNGVLTFSVTNSLGVSNGISFNLFVTPTNNGTVTNTFTATANQLEPSTNYFTNVVTSVNAPSADMGVSLFGAPNPVLAGNFVTYTIVITNGGPSFAVGPTATNVLPAGMVLYTSSASTGAISNSGAVSTWNAGTLSAYSNVTLTIVAQATAANGATNLDTVNVGSSIFDPLKFNNFSSFKIVVNPAPSLSIASGSHNFTITWPATATNFVLQGATNLPPPGVWTTVTNVPAIVGGQYTITLPTNGYRFFILKTLLP